MSFLGPLLGAVVPSILGGISGRRTAERGRGTARGPGQLGLEQTLARIQGGPIGPEFGPGVLEAPLAQAAQVFGRRQRLRAGQAAQTGRLGAAQRARLFQQAEQSTAGNLLQGRLRAGVAGAQARQQERLGRERMQFEASLFAEQLARQREQEQAQREFQQQTLGAQIAGSGAQLGFGIAGQLFGQQQQRRTEELFQPQGQTSQQFQTPQLNVGAFEQGLSF